MLAIRNTTDLWR